MPPRQSSAAGPSASRNARPPTEIHRPHASQKTLAFGALVFGAFALSLDGCTSNRTRHCNNYSPLPRGRCFPPSPDTPSAHSCPGYSCSRRVLAARRTRPSAWRGPPGRAGSGRLHPRGRLPKLAGKRRDFSWRAAHHNSRVRM